MKITYGLLAAFTLFATGEASSLAGLDIVSIVSNLGAAGALLWVTKMLFCELTENRKERQEMFRLLARLGNDEKNTPGAPLT